MSNRVSELTHSGLRRLSPPLRPPLFMFLVGAAVCGGAEAQEPKPAPPPPPPSCFQGTPVSFPPQPTVRRSYIEIVYDAKARQLWWIDRAGVSHGGHGSIQIYENSVFAPVTYVKDRMIVTICNTKFNTEPAISVATTAIPEGGPDIRGLAAASTAAALAAPSAVALAAEAKQAAAASAPAPKSAEDYAQMAASYHETFQRLMTELLAFRCAPAPAGGCALDTVSAIQKRAADLQKEVSSPRPPSDQAAFDFYSARTKSLVDSINSLAATLSAGDYLNRASSAVAAYAALQPAVAKLSAPPNVSAIVAEAVSSARSVTVATNRNGFPPDLKNDAGAAVSNVMKAASNLQADPSASDLNVNTARTGAQSAQAYLLHIQQIGDSTDLPSATDLRNVAQKLLQAAQQPKPGPTLADIDASLRKYLGSAPTFKEIMDNDRPELLFAQTDGLSHDVTTLHTRASEIFDRMNHWREDSRVTLTGVVPPTSGNAVFTVHIILHDTYAPFAFGTAAKKDSSSDGSGAKSSTGTITAAAATGVGPEQHEVRRVLVEVHRKANANLVGAVIGSTLPNRQFGLEPGAPISNAAGTVIPYYVYQSQNDQMQIQAIAGINWYIGGRDFYPGYLRGARRMIPGILLGTTVTSAGNFVGGLDFEPVNGLDILVGAQVGPITSLAPGVTIGPNSTGTYFASGDTIPTVQHLGGGFVFGLGFDLSTFSAIFGGGSAPSSSPGSAPK